MKKYTVLLADDEEEVIQVILKKIDWNGLGLSVIGHAPNGVKALEMVEESRPDIVITDIKMPYMDGLELSRILKKQYPDTKILIFTGFDEFEYAKEAVHLEIEEYILKPATSAELTEVLQRVRDSLHKEISEKRNTEVLLDYYLESLPLLQANFYSALIEGRIPKKEIQMYMSNYRIRFEKKYLCCIVIHTSITKIPEGMDAMLLVTSVTKFAEERLNDKWTTKSFSYLGNTVMIAQLDSESKVSELTDDCEKVSSMAKRMIGAIVTVGIGQVFDDISLMPMSYAGARRAVSYRAIYGTDCAINIREIAPKETVTNSSSENLISAIFHMVRVGTNEQLEEAVKGYVEGIIDSSKSLQQHQLDIMELTVGLYKFISNNDIPIDDELKDSGKLFEYLSDMGANTLKSWLCNIMIRFRDTMSSARGRSAQQLVARAKEYVNNNYALEDISLDSVCEELGVSNSYFSTIFKKETGTSFIGFLTDYRMEKAARLLIETSEKSYIIAQNVGYMDANYFSYVFKRKFGMSPSKYRSKDDKS